MFLHSLRTDCYVNVVGFGSTHHLLFPEGSRKYDDEVLKLVQDYAAGYSVFKSNIRLPFLLMFFLFSAMNADLDGSEIIEPLQAVFELPTVDGYARQVFVITDGVVNKSEPYYKSLFIFTQPMQPNTGFPQG